MLWKIMMLLIYLKKNFDKIINYEGLHKAKTFNESQHILSTHNSPSPE